MAIWLDYFQWFKGTIVRAFKITFALAGNGNCERTLFWCRCRPKLRCRATAVNPRVFKKFSPLIILTIVAWRNIILQPCDSDKLISRLLSRALTEPEGTRKHHERQYPLLVSSRAKKTCSSSDGLSVKFQTNVQHTLIIGNKLRKLSMTLHGEMSITWRIWFGVESPLTARFVVHYWPVAEKPCRLSIKCNDNMLHDISWWVRSGFCHSKCRVCPNERVHFLWVPNCVL